MFLGHAGLDPQAAGRGLHPRRLQRRRHPQRHLPEPRRPRRGDRDPLRPLGHQLPRHPGILLPDPRPDHPRPPGQRHRPQLPFRHLLRRRGAAPHRRGHHRGRRGERTVAGEGGHGGRAAGRLLGGRAGAPGLPGALPQRLHLPLPAAELEAAAPRGVHDGLSGRPGGLVWRVVAQGRSWERNGSELSVT
ncbi:hypothetical protein SGPA1_20989 [Streptomyces misionensis JCM 4497]